jgi:hypothetical protein
MPPLRVRAIIKRSKTWKVAGSVFPLSRWAPLVILSTSQPASISKATIAASKSGVGLAYVDPSSPDGITHISKPVRPAQDSIARDRLIEVVYRQWLRQKTATPAIRSQAFNCRPAG